jgi:hypothetical protein
MRLDQKIRLGMFAIAAVSIVLASVGLHSALHLGAFEGGGNADLHSRLLEGGGNAD